MVTEDCDGSEGKEAEMERGGDGGGERGLWWRWCTGQTTIQD